MTGPAPDRRDIWHENRNEGARRRQKRLQRRRGHGLGRWLAVAGYGGVALVCLALAALAFVLVAPPLDLVRDRLAKQVHARTGRTLTVSGPMSASLFPRVVVSLGDVAIRPPQGVEGAGIVTVPSLEAETSLWSLVARRPRIERLTLHRPTIELAIDAQGRRSWEPAAPQNRPVPPGASEARGDQRRLSSDFAGLKAIARPRRQLQPWAVRVVDGTVRYRDDRSGTHHEIGALNVDMAMASPSGPAEISGGFTWQGVPLRFSGTVSAELLLDGRPGQVALTLAGEPIAAAYRGTLGVRDGLSANGNLTTDRLAYKGLKLGPSALAISIDGGGAKATLEDAEVYGGRGQGSVTLDTTGPTPAVAANLKLSGVSLLPLLSDAGSIGWLDGRGTIALDLGGQGRSEREIVETLQGKVQVAVAEGAVSGIDIDRSMRALQRGRLGDVTPRREDRTPFSQLSGTFDIANGVAKNQDLKLVSAHLQLSGDGVIELAPRRIDYTLQTKIAGASPDKDAAFRIGTLEFPVAIKGPLERPEFTIKAPEGLADTVEQIGRKLRSREVQDAIRGLFSGDDETRAKPADLIEKLFKKE